jgi:hypothetical protein
MKRIAAAVIPSEIPELSGDFDSLFAFDSFITGTLPFVSGRAGTSHYPFRVSDPRLRSE